MLVLVKYIHGDTLAHAPNVLSCLRRPVEGRGVLHALAEACVDCCARHPEALARRVHGHRQLRAPPHAHALLAGDAVVAAVKLHAEAAVAAQVGGAHLRSRRASGLPARARSAASRRGAPRCRRGGGSFATTGPRLGSGRTRAPARAPACSRTRRSSAPCCGTSPPAAARRQARRGRGHARRHRVRTPSGGRKPPTTVPSHASTLKKRRSTAQPALRIASIMNFTVAPAQRKRKAISRLSHPARSATRGRTALQRIVQRLLTYLGRHAPRRRGARASAC